MKIKNIFFLILSIFFLVSCNKDEGVGGSSSIEGYVYNIIHTDDNFTFRKDTFPAVDQRVFITFGGETSIGDDVRTNYDGKYRFDYLRKGNYTVYAVSEYAGGRMEGVKQEVSVGKGVNSADAIFINTGKANGTSMIRGSVYATYWHNGKLEGRGPAVGGRVYIKYAGEEAFFDDLRISDKGVFIFQKILPGDYEIHVETEDPETRVVSTIYKTVKVTETEKVYQIPEDVETAGGLYSFLVDII